MRERDDSDDMKSDGVRALGGWMKALAREIFVDREQGVTGRR
jgi:hypothetical protein